jgi:tryptophanyl-tRNA synthetase
MKTLVGVRPTGKLHLGHYFSVIKPALEENADVLVARYHAPFGDWVQMSDNLFSFGLKPKIQDVNDELYFKLLELASFGELNRMTQFKDKGKINVHLFVYPILMTCDLIGYDKVIVGDDQRQHLEFAKRLLKKIDLPCPEPDFRGGRIMSLIDPSKKMSKSEPNGCLFLDDNFELKLKKAVTTKEGIKNLTYIAKQFNVKWDPKDNLHSKIVLADAIKKEIDSKRI